MTQKTKQYLSFIVLIIVFVFLSAINIWLLVIKNNSDILLVYVVAVLFFIHWLVGLICPNKIFQFYYKMFKKPMSKSMTMDFMGISEPSKKKAYETFKKFIETCPYIYSMVLVIGIVLLLLF